MYWSQDEDLAIRAVSERMTRSRFREIKKYFHLQNNDELDKTDKLTKLRQFMAIIQKNLQQFGFFEKDLSLDESMVPYYGHHSAKMFMKGKPIRFGYKIWMLCSSDGYPFAFEVYTGKSGSNDDGPLGEQVSRRLTSEIEVKRNHVLYMDNFFSSTSLYRKHINEELRCTGTVRRNRTEGCPMMSEKAMKSRKRGYHEAFTDGDVNICHWNDNRPVVLVSTDADESQPKEATRWSRSEKKRIRIAQPAMVASYNANMGGVDLLDRFLSDYRPRLRSKKWWWILFSNFLNMCVVAAWRVRRHFNPHIPHLSFRR